MNEKIKAILEDAKIKAFYVSKIENVRYLSGYTGDDSYLLLTETESYFITDPRYTEQAEAECKDFSIINWRSMGISVADCVASLVQNQGADSLGFESEVITYSDYEILRGSVKCELVPLVDCVEKLRSVKTEFEIECQKTACSISCRALERVMKDIKVGVSEKEIGAKLSYYMVNEGADAQPYGQIVIAGARTSLLHGIPSDNKVEDGDLVLLDFGCAYKGYLSDMTRTFVVGKATAKQKEVYEIEKKMVEAALGVMKASVSGKEVYDATLPFIEGTEYFQYHYTGIGHGIGMYVHEIPYMGPKYGSVLSKNNVVTIEPGIYIPSWGGIRIEDQVIIKEDGCENMVSFTRELIEL